MSIISRFFNVFRPRALEREFDEELGFHVDEQIARNLRHGMDQAQAESSARQQFGDVIHAKNGMREVRMMNRRVVGAFALGLMIGVLAATLFWYREPVTSGPAFYRAGQDGTSTPVLLREAKPHYTPDAMRAKIAGVVMMECVVQPNGTCDTVHVTRSLDPGLDREAINALQLWRFQPGQRLGKPVPVLVTIEIAFTLRS